VVAAAGGAAAAADAAAAAAGGAGPLLPRLDRPRVDLTRGRALLPPSRSCPPVAVAAGPSARLTDGSCNCWACAASLSRRSLAAAAAASAAAAAAAAAACCRSSCCAAASSCRRACQGLVRGRPGPAAAAAPAPAAVRPPLVLGNPPAGSLLVLSQSVIWMTLEGRRGAAAAAAAPLRARCLRAGVLGGMSGCGV
jgi:hypothetical protein